MLRSRPKRLPERCQRWQLRRLPLSSSEPDGTTARCPPRNFLRRLSETVNFDQGVAGGVVYAGNYRGVATGCQGGFDGRFGIVWQGQPGSLDLCLLSALPIVVGGDARPVAIAQVQKWIRQ